MHRAVWSTVFGNHLTPDRIDATLLGQDGGPQTRHARAPGLLEKAHRGILCLDDVAALPQIAQTRLLKLIEAAEFWPAGAAAPRPLDLQIIATAETASQGDLHPGLYYRLSRAIVTVPPLSERVQDIPALFRHFLQSAADRLSRSVPPLTDLALAHLAAHRWPGNLRELQAFAEHHLLGLDQDAANPVPARPPLAQMVATYEAALIRDTLRDCQGHATQAMEMLGLPRKTFYDKLSRHGIKPASYRDPS